MASWAAQHLDQLREARPVLPDALDDRAADGWEPLLGIADQAGGDWPARARQAALALSTGESREDESFGIQLLRDVRTIYEEKGIDRMTTADLVAGLNGLE